MKKSKWTFLTILPIYLFTIIFVIFPLVYMIFLSFMTRADVWGVTLDFTIENYIRILEPLYRDTFFESTKLALSSTIIISILGYPFGYFMACLDDRWKKKMVLIIMIPFWTSSLIRLYGWIIIFRSKGVLDQILMHLHLTEKPLKLLYSYSAVTSGMVYALLPFMILSVYSSVEKMDWSLVEASRDLGAGGVKTFLYITFPLTLPGLFSGVILTLIPSMGLFFISDILGGNKILLVGSMIQEQMTKARNMPFAAAMAVVLMLFTTLMIAGYRILFRTKEIEGLV